MEITPREIAGVAAAEAWTAVGACTKGTPEWEIAMQEWEVRYSAWRVLVGPRSDD